MELKVGDRVVANYNGQNLRGPVRMVHATAVHVATGKGMRLIPISAIIRVNNRNVKGE